MIAFAESLGEIALFRQYGDEMYRQKRYRSEQRNPKIVQRNPKPKNEERVIATYIGLRLKR